MNNREFTLPDIASTDRLARGLAEAVRKSPAQSLIIALNGPLGVGKTKFVQCFALALGVEEVVNSPTFTMLNEYHSGSIPLYHLDLYRLGESDTNAAVQYLEEELSEILRYPHALLIEWAELLNQTEDNFLARLDHICAVFSYGEVQDERVITSGSASLYKQLEYKQLEERRVSLTASGSNSGHLLNMLQVELSARADN